MRPAKRATCFFCKRPILWSSWHYYWFDAYRNNGCITGGRIGPIEWQRSGLHVAMEVQA